ncbi:MAG: M56 family metallopeptidase [Muribaculaceae bacterium]|nr:M56 family metallopeptidase [Muribaculaceae bacterium]
MGHLLVFSLKSAILLTVIFSIYMLVLSRIKGASLRRWALIATYIAALSLPIFNFRYPTADNSVSTIQSGVGTLNRNIVATVAVETPYLYKIIAIVLLAGMVVLLLHTLYGFAKMYRLKIRGREVISKGLKLTVIPGHSISPFCFGGKIFVSEEDYNTMSDMVFIHENSHIIHRHFIDLMIGRIILILQWWNPFAWLMLREVHTVHEFQADNSVLNAGYDRVEYQYMLLNRVSGHNRFSLGNGLGHTKLKQRLKMMNRSESSRGKSLSALLLLPAALIGLLLLSSPIIAPTLASASMISVFSQHDNSVKGETISFISTDQPIHTPGEPDIMLNGQLVAPETINSINPAMIKSISVFKNMIEFPDGLIDIKLKGNVDYESLLQNMDNEDNSNFRLEEGIKVIGYGTVKKNPLTGEPYKQ